MAVESLLTTGTNPEVEYAMTSPRPLEVNEIEREFFSAEFTVVKLVVGEVVDEDVNDIPSA